MGEQPIYTAKAHVFNIDPSTKRSWIPASGQAVNVNFYYDSARNLYRIISVEGSKAVINSTITPNMTFTKTSQKFGQWSDIRANTVYGLGFATEGDLNKFIEKFQEMKEATRNAAQQKAQLNGSTNCMNNGGGDRESNDRNDQLHHPEMSIFKSTLSHQRSQSLSHLQATKAMNDGTRSLTRDKTGSTVLFPSSSTEAQLRYENDRLKLALAQSSANAKKWEIELMTLKNNNSRLTSALQESAENVELWKRQLQSLKEENQKLRSSILELEAANGNPEAVAEIHSEVAHLRVRNEALQADLKAKDTELEMVNKRLEEQSNIYSSGVKSDDKVKMLMAENESLRSQLSRINGHSSPDHKVLLEQMNQRLVQNINQFRSIQQELNNLLNVS